MPCARHAGREVVPHCSCRTLCVGLATEAAQGYALSRVLPPEAEAGAGALRAAEDERFYLVSVEPVEPEGAFGMRLFLQPA